MFQPSLEMRSRDPVDDPQLDSRFKPLDTGGSPFNLRAGYIEADNLPKLSPTATRLLLKATLCSKRKPGRDDFLMTYRSVSDQSKPVDIEPITVARIGRLKLANEKTALCLEGIVSPDMVSPEDRRNGIATTLQQIGFLAREKFANCMLVRVGPQSWLPPSELDQAVQNFFLGGVTSNDTGAFVVDLYDGPTAKMPVYPARSIKLTN